jgi:hypothetical protein
VEPTRAGAGEAARGSAAPGPPIFVVGLPRSGTTLLAAMLSSHSRLDCGPETQFFRRLGPGQLAAAVGDPRWPEKATGLLGSITLAGQPVTGLFGTSGPEIFSHLQTRSPSVAAMLESLTATHAARRGKRRWIEKTPAHLLCLDTIRATYARAPIIRIVRDPRDSAVSLSQLPWGRRSALANGARLCTWFERSRRFFDIDGNHLTVKYEELVGDAEGQLRRVCDFIGEEFEPAMLDTSRSATRLSSPRETWKSRASRPLTTERSYLWRRMLPPDLAAAITFVCCDVIAAFGYEADVTPVMTLPTYNYDWRAIERHEDAVVRAARHGVRLAACPAPLRPWQLLVLSDPRLGQAGLSRWGIRLIAVLLARRLVGKTNLRIDSSEDREFAARARWPFRVLRLLSTSLVAAGDPTLAR